MSYQSIVQSGPKLGLQCVNVEIGRIKGLTHGVVSMLSNLEFTSMTYTSVSKQSSGHALISDILTHCLRGKK